MNDASRPCSPRVPSGPKGDYGRRKKPHRHRGTGTGILSCDSGARTVDFPVASIAHRLDAVEADGRALGTAAPKGKTSRHDAGGRRHHLLKPVAPKHATHFDSDVPGSRFGEAEVGINLTQIDRPE